MRAILIAIGSLGDTLPFLALGKALRERGHQVALGANGHFRELIERHGLEFSEVYPTDEYREFVENYRSWSLGQLVDAGKHLMDEWMRKSFALIEDRYVPGETVVASVACAFGARLAREARGVPTATVHLQPMWMRSTLDGTCLPSWMPRLCFRAVEGTIDALIDAALCPLTNAFRAQLGLRPERKLLRTWWHSPDRILNLFPEWFSPRQADWPANTLCTGFPRVDHLHEADQGDEVERFLAAGTPPLVFARSSIETGDEFFAISRDVARRLGRRALLVTAEGTDGGGDGGDVLATPFLRLDRVLPRSAAIVHHGGIGTIAAGLAAGVPQITVPSVPDQYDNSHRLQRLGVSVHRKRRDYRPRVVARDLDRLLSSDRVRTQCRHFAMLAARDDGLKVAADALEAMAMGIPVRALARRGFDDPSGRRPRQPPAQEATDRNFVAHVNDD